MAISITRALALTTALGAATLIGAHAIAQTTAPPSAPSPSQSAPSQSAPGAGAPETGPRGMGPGMGPGMGSGTGPGMGPGMREGMREGMGPRMGRSEGERGYGGRRYGDGDGRMGRWSEQDRQAMLDAHIAAAKAGLLLTAEQEELWPAVESAVRDAMKQRQDWRERLRSEGPASDPIERMRRMGEMASARGAALTRIAEAAAPLYASLSDDQKRRLRLIHGMARGGGMMGMMGMMDGGRGMGPGMGQGMGRGMGQGMGGYGSRGHGYGMHGHDHDGRGHGYGRRGGRHHDHHHGGRYGRGSYEGEGRGDSELSL